jgi:hypothetical protein
MFGAKLMLAFKVVAGVSIALAWLALIAWLGFGDMLLSMLVCGALWWWATR